MLVVLLQARCKQRGPCVRQKKAGAEERVQPLATRPRRIPGALIHAASRCRPRPCSALPAHLVVPLASPCRYSRTSPSRIAWWSWWRCASQAMHEHAAVCHSLHKHLTTRHARASANANSPRPLRARVTKPCHGRNLQLSTCWRCHEALASKGVVWNSGRSRALEETSTGTRRERGFDPARKVGCVRWRNRWYAAKSRDT